MYDKEIEILSILADSQSGVQFKSLTDAESETLDRLLELGFVKRSICLSDNTALNMPVVYSITPTGREALSLALQKQEQERQRRADQIASEERQQLQSEALAAKNRRNVLLSAIVGAIVGAIVTGLIARFLH